MTMAQVEEKTNGNGLAVNEMMLTGLRPTPADIWRTMCRFAGPGEDELRAMRQTVDVLFQRGYELVTGTYDYLQRVPETAEVLGWERGVDEAHLAERRRFFTIWLARTISIDLGTGYGDYLYHAGQVHAAHGPRAIHTPSMWVTGSMGLVLGAFAGFIQSAHDDVKVVAPALAGWNKYLMIQLNQMSAGYESALALDAGDLSLTVTVYGTLRQAWGRTAIDVHYRDGEPVASLLARLLSYAPVLRGAMFRQGWEEANSHVDHWTRVAPSYDLKDGVRVLLNGKDLRYSGGFGQPLTAGDTLDLFPPGR
jgi:molybdopterin converting factor small subunit